MTTPNQNTYYGQNQQFPQNIYPPQYVPQTLPYNVDYVLQENARLKIEVQQLQAKIYQLEAQLGMFNPVVINQPVQTVPIVVNPPLFSPMGNNYCTICGVTAFGTCAGRPYGRQCGMYYCRNHMNSRWHNGNEYFLCGGCYDHHRYHRHEADCIVQ